MLKPLDDVRQTIDLIANVSDRPAAEVRKRLLAEVAEIGTNVHAGMQQQQIPLYVASEGLDAFYRNSDAFLFETTVWNCCTAKQQMRDFVSSRLTQFGKDHADVFCFGDGLGFDSTYLAGLGHRVRYFEPSLRCQEYAQQVFTANGVEVTRLESLDDISPGSLDALVCLDVLEHVPQPQLLVQRFHEWLKPDGLLFVHAPFWCIHWTRSTHLKENRRFSGDLKKLYQRSGFSPLDASVFWDPILFQKTDSPNPYSAPMSASVRIQLGRLLLTAGRWDGSVHTWIARKIARAPQDWAAALQQIDDL
ncbi:MAG: methyltransferase domain-containing protein [Fuerstiella sp.]